MTEYFNNIVNLTLDPSGRLYWPFLLSSLCLSLVFLNKEQIKELFSKKGFFHESSITDIKLLLLNLFLKSVVFPIFLFSSFSVSVFILKFLRGFFPHFDGVSIGDGLVGISLTFLAFVINDFFRFSHHFLMHKIPFLRNLHGVHHSAKVLTPLTLFRAHPLEALLASFRNIISLGSILALFSFLSNAPVTLVDILGVNIFGFLFNALGANLRHSPVPMSFGFFEYIFISPRMHQIHHSNNIKHKDKNYGVALSIWDQMLGSFYRPTAPELKKIEFGFKKKDKKVLAIFASDLHNLS